MAKKKNKKSTGPAQVTTATSWKSAGGKNGTPLEVPSGNTALVRAPGLQVFMQQGFIPNSLMAIVQEAINKGKPPKMEEFKLTEDSLEEYSSLIDNVVVYCVLDPKVNPILYSEPDPETGVRSELPRDPNLLYVDEVELEDKTFIFQFAVGGTRDVEKFREELRASVGAVQSREGVEDLTQFTPPPVG